ncbi:MAG: tetratricopeptide repeat protein [Xanthobacteraceae bacterium]
MSWRIPRAPVVAVLACAAALVAGASDRAAAQAQQPNSGTWAHPPAQAQRLHNRTPIHDLAFLFGALKAAPDETSAEAIENRIWAHWLASGSDTVNLLMVRVKHLIEKENYDIAVRMLDAIIEIRPQYAEAWNRRATVFYLKKDYGSALADLRQVLRREPRHFGALSGLGTIMQDIGDEKHALEAYRAALDVYPRLKGVGDRVKTLTEKVEGRPI